MTGRAELEHDLVELGVGAGDRVVVHSSLRAIGRVDGGPDTVVAALLAVLGPLGTLVVPTFTYATGAASPVDLRTAPALTGAVAEAVRAAPGSLRSDHPTHPVAALGTGARALTEGHLDGRAMAAGSPLGRLVDSGGKVLLVGVGHTSNTTIHVGEECAGAPKPVPPEGLPTLQVRCADGRLAECRLDTSPSCSAAFGTVEVELRDRGAVRDGLVGAALAQLMTGRAVVEAVAAILARSPSALLCTRPGCRPCALSRASLSEAAC